MKIEPRYLGLLGGIAEANDISAELGVSFDEAMAVQRERSSERLLEEPNVIFFRAPKVIAENVAAQMGITPDEAEAHMARFDLMALETFHRGNSVPRSELH